LLALVLAACAEEPPPARTATVKAADYGEAWPLLALQGTLGCEPPSAAYIEVNGKRYGLNGKALSAGLPRGDEVTRKGSAVGLSIFIDMALATCPDRR
jgi:hypothetical protein